MVKNKKKPTFNEEKLLWEKGFKLVAGLDEVGRGCFAGPVVIAAVIFPVGFQKRGEINDSKLLTKRKRESVDKYIRKNAISFSVAEISVEIINSVGIVKATQIGFSKALSLLNLTPDFLLIDAFYINSSSKRIQKPIIHGDRISCSIAAASVIAKVYRDKLMEEIDPIYPQYNFKIHKGYGTKSHQSAIRTYGLSKIHRTSFNLSKFLNITETNI